MKIFLKKFVQFFQKETIKVYHLDNDDYRREEFREHLSKEFQDVVISNSECDIIGIKEENWDLLILHESNKECDDILMDSHFDETEKIIFTGARDVKDHEKNIKLKENFLNADYLVEYINDIIFQFSESSVIPLELGPVQNTQSFSTRHDKSNFWGAYRLLRFLTENFPNQNLKDKLEETKIELSSRNKMYERYMNEEVSELQSRVDVTLDRIKKKYSELLRRQDLKIAVVDDMMEAGWGQAYESLFQLGQYENEVIIIQSLEEAKELDTSTLDLVIVDLRITETAKGEEKDILSIKDLSGIRLMNEMKAKDPTLPIILATASNKVWSYEAAFNSGATACWTKESPELGVSDDMLLLNSVSLMEILCEALTWSLQTRPLLMGLEMVCKKLGKDYPKYCEEVEQKAKHINAQLIPKHGDFVTNTFGNSHLDFSFLALWSIGNVLRDIFCKTNNEKDVLKHEVFINNQIHTFCRYSRGEYKLDRDVIKILSRKRGDGTKWYPKNEGKTWYFPDNFLIEYLLTVKSLNDDRIIFNKIKSLRNNLEYVHGGTLRKGSMNISTLDPHYDILGIFYKLIFGVDDFPYERRI